MAELFYRTYVSFFYYGSFYYVSFAACFIILNVIFSSHFIKLYFRGTDLVWLLSPGFVYPILSIMGVEKYNSMVGSIMNLFEPTIVAFIVSSFYAIRLIFFRNLKISKHLSCFFILVGVVIAFLVYKFTPPFPGE